jgi:excisionase family DNA binding protein
MTWMTRQEAADHLKVSLRTIDAMKANGRIGFHEIEMPGGRKLIRFSTEDLDGLAQPRRNEPRHWWQRRGSKE